MRPTRGTRLLLSAIGCFTVAAAGLLTAVVCAARVADRALHEWDSERGFG